MSGFQNRQRLQLALQLREAGGEESQTDAQAGPSQLHASWLPATPTGTAAPEQKRDSPPALLPWAFSYNTVLDCLSSTLQFNLQNLPSPPRTKRTIKTNILWGEASQVALVLKNPTASAEDIRDESSIPESERSPGEGNGNPLQYCCLGNFMNRGAW